MGKLARLVILLTTVLFCFQIKSFAQPGVAEANWNMQWGLYYASQGDVVSANNYYAAAKGIAYQNNLYMTMLQVSWCYAGLGYNSDETWRCYSMATEIAYNWSKSGQRNFAIDALRQCVGYYNNNLANRVQDPATQRQLIWLAEQARNNVAELQRVGTSNKVEVGIDAYAGFNHTSAGMRTRGFGDSNEIDVWVPFNFSYGPCGNISYAKIILDLKPIDADLQTEHLRIVGKSGTVHTFNRPLSTGQKGQRMNIEVDLKSHAQWKDIQGALNSGFVQACFEDDTAVFGAKLVVHCILQ